jgi:glycosyltransferase involved in cell wall biosynthesis
MGDWPLTVGIAVAESSGVITIIVPTIGRSTTIAESIRSATACSERHVTEILIADNSQDEATGHRLREYAALDSRIRIIGYPERLGMAESWNAATAQTRGKWILYLHDDDVLYPASIAKAVLCLDDSAGFVYSNCDISRDTGVTHWKYEQKDAVANILSLCPRFVSTIIHREALDEIGGWDARDGYALDVVAFLTLARRRPAVHCNSTLGMYRIHEDNSSSRERRNRGYGDSLGHVVGKLFAEYEDEATRRKILALLVTFVYPIPDSIPYRVLRKLARLMKAEVMMD